VRRVVAIAVVVAAVAGVGFVGYTAVNNPSIFGAATSEPSRRPVAAGSPVATAAPTTSASARPAPPTASPASDPAARFLAFASDPTWSFRMEADATVKVNGEQLSVLMVLNQAGPDFSFEMRIQMRGRSGTVNVIVKDEVAYIREKTGPWRRVGNPAAVDLPVGSLAFSQLKASEAVLVRTETRRGKELHLLRVPSTVAAGVDPTEIARLGCDTSDLGLDLWVRSDGTPVTASFDYECVQPSSTGAETLTSTASYEFSRVGRPIVIDLPPGVN
jgi:hypothetical protein